MAMGIASGSRRVLFGLLILGSMLASGCQSAGGFAAGLGATTLVGGNTPTDEIMQVYYLGVFDPLDQVQPLIYRVTVRGQSSAISGTKFASGWVRASLIDSLGTNLNINAADPAVHGIELHRSAGLESAAISPMRRLVQFGPEGFREAPAAHRLVIVMGASPKAFFEAMDQTLGIVSGYQEADANTALRTEIFQAMIALEAERRRLDDLQDDLNREQRESEAAASAAK